MNWRYSVVKAGNCKEWGVLSTNWRMKKTILILGGGFGGVYTAVYLEKLMTAAERETTDIIIVSRDNYIVFSLCCQKSFPVPWN